MVDGPRSYVADALAGAAPKLAALTDEVLFADIWERPELSKRDRSLITLATLIANGSFAQLQVHVGFALENGLTAPELQELVLHAAFYAGWPKAMSAAALISQTSTGN